MHANFVKIMIAEVLYLGPIRSAKVDLDKPLTIFCGPNSTGKTYLSYLLYAIYDDMEFVDSKNLTKIAKTILTEHKYILTKEIVDDFLSDIAEGVKSRLGSIFGIGDVMVDKLFSQFQLKLSIDNYDFEKIIHLPCRISTRTGEYERVFSKEADSAEITYNINGDINEAGREELINLNFMLNRFFHRLCIGKPGGARMLTVERNSIYTFKTELSIRRNELLDRIQQKSTRSEIEIMDIVNSSSRRYPLAVRSSLRIANDLENVQKHRSTYAPIADMIEKGVLKGEVKITRNGDVEFVSFRAGSSRHLPIHMSSSIVKTMSSLVIYLKHIAQKGDLLIIDEPEMNFHPDVQISLTQIFAILSKLDLRIIISTHSDYVIREINNLIMAGSLSDKQFVKDCGYNEDMLLTKDSVTVKYFHYGKLKRYLDVIDIKVTDDGFSVQSIDNTINKQNQITETLFDRLQGEKFYD